MNGPAIASAEECSLDRCGIEPSEQKSRRREQRRAGKHQRELPAQQNTQVLGKALTVFARTEDQHRRGENRAVEYEQQQEDRIGQSESAVIRWARASAPAAR